MTRGGRSQGAARHRPDAASQEEKARNPDLRRALAEARARGAQVQRELADACGGLVRERAAAKRAGLSVSELRERTAEGQLLVLPLDGVSYWPVILLDHWRQVGPGLAAARAGATIHSGWSWLGELLRNDEGLGTSPFAALMAGRTAEVVAAFAGWGEMGR